jgi:hypothetical protein
MIYSYKRKLKPKAISIRLVAQQEDYYDLKRNDPSVDKDGVDQLLWMSEQNSAPIITRLLTAPSLSLSGEEKGHLSWFVGLMALRTEFAREMLISLQTAFHNRDIKKMLKDDKEFQELIKANPDAKIEELEMARKGFLEDDLKLEFGRGGETEDHFMGQQLGFANDIVKIIQHKHWNLIETNNSRSFLTSDNPVVTMPAPHHTPDMPFGYADGDVLLPLSPKRALFFTNRPLANKIIQIHRNKMPEFQFYSITQCQSSVFSHVASQEFQRVLDITEEGKVHTVYLPEE